MQDFRQKMKEVFKKLSENENWKQFFRKRYQDDIEFREKKFKIVFIRYLDDDVF